MRHSLKECHNVKKWFNVLNKNKEERWKRIWDDELDKMKNKILRKFWRRIEKQDIMNVTNIK